MRSLRDQLAAREIVWDRVRTRWAEIILNIAEVLPPFSGGVIADLQATRKEQRESSKRDFKNSRLPEGAHLELRRLIFLQLHTIEDFDTVNKRLLRLFPETGADHPQYLRGGLDSLSGVSWATVGRIARSSQFFFGGETAVMEGLPAEVDHITVEVRQVLPSFFILSFGVRLTENVSTQILRLYEAKYFGRITFNRWFVWKWGRSYGQPEISRERAISDFIRVIRVKMEAFLERYFPNPAESRNDGFTLIEEFHLKYKDVARAMAVPNNSTRWRGQFGLDTYDCFAGDHIIFLPAHNWTGVAYPDRVLVTEDVKTEEEAGHTSLRIREIIRSLEPFLALLHVLSSFENTTARLRRQVFERIMVRRRFSSFRREIMFNAVPQIQRTSLARISLEYKQHRNLLASWCSDLKLLTHAHPQKDPVNLLDALQRTVTDRMDLVSDHLQLASESFERHVSARNIGLTYGLSWKVFALSVVVTLATLLNLFANWSTVWCRLKSIIVHFH